MTISLDTLRRDFLALLGESPGLSPILEEDEEAAVLLLEDRIRVNLLPLAIEATLETPLLWLDDIESVDAEAQPSATGSIRISLPDNYLRLYSLKLAGWKEAVSDTEPEGSLRCRLGANTPFWMACNENPLVIERRDTRGHYLHVCGVTTAKPVVEHLLYVVKPSVSNDTLRISAAAYPRLLDKLALTARS